MKTELLLVDRRLLQDLIAEILQNEFGLSLAAEGGGSSPPLTLDKYDLTSLNTETKTRLSKFIDSA